LREKLALASRGAMGGVVTSSVAGLRGLTVVTVIVLLSTSVYFVSAQVTPGAVPGRRSKDPADPCKAGEY